MDYGIDRVWPRPTPNRSPVDGTMELQQEHRILFHIQGAVAHGSVSRSTKEAIATVRVPMGDFSPSVTFAYLKQLLVKEVIVVEGDTINSLVDTVSRQHCQFCIFDDTPLGV
jgi:hypothetical protein